jgi:hypothetical protein
MAAQHDDMEVPDGPPYVVGWKEYVGFVDWPLRRVRAKIDTGARTSALDVLSYELREGGSEGGLTATLRLALDPKRSDRIQEVVTPVLKMVVVCNSSGMREQRPLVETTLRLGPVAKKVRLTITNRAGMRFRMILGRKALEGDFVVDVARKYLMRRVK